MSQYIQHNGEDYMQQYMDHYIQLIQTVEHDIFHYEAKIYWDLDRYEMIKIMQSNLEDDMISLLSTV